MELVDKLDVIKPVIDNKFITELITGLLSSPIIFIPHYHFLYLDCVLKKIIDKSSHKNNGINISFDDVLEFNESRGIINFDTKKEEESERFSAIIKDVLNAKDDYGTKGKKIFLCKGALLSLFEKKEIMSDFALYASLYEEGLFDPLTTFILIDNIPISNLPCNIIPYTKVLEIPLPTDNVIAKLLEGIPFSATIPSNEHLSYTQSIVRIFQGLHQQQIISILRSVLVRTGGRLSDIAKELAEIEKKNLLKKSDTLEIVDSNVRLDQVGGLDVLKMDIQVKSRIFNNLHLASSNRINIPFPKGILILGMPGCGKSMIAKAIANEFDIPLLRLDINRMMGKYVGESEENLRKALQIAEAAHPCVLWIDEVEKAFSGSSSESGGGDSVVVRLMGYFLTWMQEKKQPVYIVATANDAMRSEFMRKGRFDEVYFVDFPNKIETEEILRKKIGRYNNPNSVFNFQAIDTHAYDQIADAMQVGADGGFSGSEIEAVVSSVVEDAFIKYLDTSSKYQIPISIQDFIGVINSMKGAVMVNQKGVDGKKTNIERIRDIQRSFCLKSATQNNNSYGK